MDSTPPVALASRAPLKRRTRELATFFAVGLVAGFVGGGIGCGIAVAIMRTLGAM